MRAALLLLLSTAAVALPREGIVTGTRAGPSDVRATVALFHADAGQPFCTGTAIGLRLVLTAAHCVTDVDRGALYLLDASDLLVFAGTVDARERTPFNEFGVERIIVHPGYDPATLDDDVALLVLDRPVSVTIARVPAAEEAQALVQAAGLVTVQGYGRTNPNDTDSGGVLHFAQMPFDRVVETELFAGHASSSDVCYGDSGGPAYAQAPEGWVVVGVTSRTIISLGRACDWGGIFMWTPAYLDWIESEAGPLLGVPPEGSAGDGGCASTSTGLLALFVLLLAARPGIERR